MEHITVPPHVQRMRIEREKLEHDIIKLRAFIEDNPIFKTLEEVEQADMNEQLVHMVNHFNVLTRRLQRAIDKV